ncbi:MAG: sensor domain-containing diguanylate cyclase [Gemmatimonadaceae bacterium]|nr:sensor domain-containing diguanylate cyclase [Gemmatimonadaceae bacterium]
MTKTFPLPTPPEAPTPRSRLPIAAIAFAYAAAYLTWLQFAHVEGRMRDLASEVVFLPLNAAVALVFLLAARRSDARAPMRRALRLLAASSATVCAGNLVTTYGVMGFGPVVPGLAHVFFLAGYPLTLAAYLSIPVGQRGMDRWKLACDAGMVLSGAGVALWYFVVHPIAGDSAALGTIILPLLYPLADLLMLVGITTVALRRPLDDHRGAIFWLGISGALVVCADLAFSLVTMVGGRRSAFATDLLFLATSITLLVSAELFLRSPSKAGSSREHHRLSNVASVLPFVAAGATYLLLSAIALGTWVTPLSGVALGAVAVSVFLGARQLRSFRLNAARVAEAAVRASEARFRSLVQHSSDLIFVIGGDGVIQFASSSAIRLLGYQPDALVGRTMAALAHRDDVDVVGAFVEIAAALPGVSPPGEWRIVGADDTIVQVEAIASNRLADDAVRGIVINARDVGERKALLDQLAHQAFHDPLTGLANRALFYDRVSHALELGQREGRTVTVLFLDLDRFKQINDDMGHAEGDHLLRLIAGRLRASARATDTVARLGGDEFAVLIEDTSVPRSTERLIDRVREQMAFPFTLSGGEVYVSASIGSASAIGGEVDEILRHADIAMYSAKRAESGSHRVFDQTMLGQAGRAT